MKWEDLLALAGRGSLFDASMLLAGTDSPSEVRRQLSRWTASRRLIQLRRGLYTLAPPFARAAPNALAIAARLRKPSYVSLQSALSFHGATPESTPAVTSVTTGRPGRVETSFGEFLYRHLGLRLFWGYRELEVGEGERAYVALPEKALLDLFYLTPGEIGVAFVRELRLAAGVVDSERLLEFAQRAARPRLHRAAVLTTRILRADRKGGKAV